VAQRLHCVHFSGSHTGTTVAIPLFSNLLVPAGCTPPTTNLDTGRVSPSLYKAGYKVFKNSGVPSGHTRGASSPKVAHSAGTSILCRLASDCFNAFRFISTTSFPFEPKRALTSSSNSLGARPPGIIGHRVKNTFCMIMLIRCFRPTF